MAEKRPSPRKKSNRDLGHGNKQPNLFRPGVDARSSSNETRIIRIGLIAAARNGDLRRLKMLLAKGIPPDAEVDRQLRTAMMIAAARGNIDAIHILVKAGASLESTCDGGFTALDIAVKHRQITSVRALLDHGAELNTQAISDQEGDQRCPICFRAINLGCGEYCRHWVATICEGAILYARVEEFRAAVEDFVTLVLNNTWSQTELTRYLQGRFPALELIDQVESDAVAYWASDPHIKKHSWSVDNRMLSSAGTDYFHPDSRFPGRVVADARLCARHLRHALKHANIDES